MRKDVDTNTYTMYYYEGLTVIAEKEKVGSGSWGWKRIFTDAPGVIGNILRISAWSGSSWNDNYYHYDALGNVVMTTLDDGTPGYKYDQEAYGNIKVGSQSGYHLTSKEYDAIGELYYFAARWYDPLLGRFISKAPLPVIIEHPYIFAENNPLNRFDPSGMKSKGKTNPVQDDFDCLCKGLCDSIQKACDILGYLDASDEACKLVAKGCKVLCEVVKKGYCLPFCNKMYLDCYLKCEPMDHNCMNYCNDLKAKCYKMCDSLKKK